MANKSPNADPDGSPGIKLSGNISSKAGLAEIHHELIADPAVIRHAIIRYDVMRRWVDTDTGEVSPILRIRDWEPLDGDLATAGLALFDQAQAARTGQLNLEQASR